jgi:hypothetical protein
VNVAVADIDRDAQAEIIAAMASQGNQIEIYRGDGTLLRKFEAFESNTGLVVAAGQIINDAHPEIIVSERNRTVVRLFDSNVIFSLSFQERTAVES